MHHAVSLLRIANLSRGGHPSGPRRGFKSLRCEGCRVAPGHCMCALRPVVPTRAGVCLLMADAEPLKPTNTGWLIADVVPDTFAFRWARTEVDPALLALLRDPQWAPHVVFPGAYAEPGRVVHSVQPPPESAGGGAGRRPLFILPDGTWSEARKIFGRSPYLNPLPVLSLQPERWSAYRLRNSGRSDHHCTSEIAAMCLELAGEQRAADTLSAWLDVFVYHYLKAKNHQPIDWQSAAHQRLGALRG